MLASLVPTPVPNSDISYSLSGVSWDARVMVTTFTAEGLSVRRHPLHVVVSTGHSLPVSSCTRLHLLLSKNGHDIFLFRVRVVATLRTALDACG